MPSALVMHPSNHYSSSTGASGKGASSGKFSLCVVIHAVFQIWKATSTLSWPALMYCSIMHCNGTMPGATRKIHSKLRKACVIVLMVVLHQSRAPFPLLRISHTVRGPPLQPGTLRTKLVHTQPSTRTNKNLRT